MVIFLAQLPLIQVELTRSESRAPSSAHHGTETPKKKKPCSFRIMLQHLSTQKATLPNRDLPTRKETKRILKSYKNLTKRKPIGKIQIPQAENLDIKLRYQQKPRTAKLKMAVFKACLKPLATKFHTRHITKVSFYRSTTNYQQNDQITFTHHLN